MTERVTTHPARAGAVLFPDGLPSDEVARLLRASGATSSLSGPVADLTAHAQRAFSRDVGKLALELVDLDLGKVLLTGWRKHRDLLAAARRTEQVAGSRETVRLATHRVRSRHEPSIDVLAGETRLTTIVLTIDLVLEVAALEASVSSGRLTALHSGSAKITATFATKDIILLTRSAPLRLPLEVPLGDGIPL